MNLLEHHAKAILREHDVPVPHSWLVMSPETIPGGISYPVVAKSQIPVGGRGKAGGIITVTSGSELPAVVERLLSLSIKSHRPTAILLEEHLNSSRELYLGLRLNRDTRQMEWLVSKKGGIDIEAHGKSVVTIKHNRSGYVDEIAQVLRCKKATLDPIITALADCFLKNDLLLLEVNPLIEQPDGSLVCADAKVLVDDNARFRQPQLPWPKTEGNLPKPLGGTIGCLANGAGMAMSTMDTIVSQGGRPANFLDIGGGTGEKEFVIALRNIMELPGVTSIIVNIFAGISRCDEIARGIIAAREQLPGLPPLFIRLEGTNRELAATLLKNAAIPIEPDLRSCVQKAMKVTS